jgi:hypothetical protein
MNRTTLAFLGAAGLLVVLSACQQIDPAGADTFGNAVAHNMELQVVNPEPTHAAGPPELSGSRAALAIGRYETDQVEKPRDFRTTTAVGVIE